MVTMTMREALRDAMAEEMRRDENVFVIGEEVAEYQGAYKVTQGLLQEFGPAASWTRRSPSTASPASRVGAALDGLRPDRRVHDLQLRHAGDGPDHQLRRQDALHVRRPDGLPHRVPRPQRRRRARRRPAQPGLRGLVLERAGPEGRLAVLPPRTPRACSRPRSAIPTRSSSWRTRSSTASPRRCRSSTTSWCPSARRASSRPGKDVTIVTWSIGMTYALKAAEELAKKHIYAEVIDLRTIRPMDIDTVVASVMKTGRCVTVEEGWPQSGVGAEIRAQIMETRLRLPRRARGAVTGKNVPMPTPPTSRSCCASPSHRCGRRSSICYRRRRYRSVRAMAMIRSTSVKRAPPLSRRGLPSMPVNVLMPALSPTMEKGNLSKWLKKEGDAIKSGDVIAEIETDKATMEVEAIDEGVLAKIVVPAGTSDVPVNDLIAVIAVRGRGSQGGRCGPGRRARREVAPERADMVTAAAPPAAAAAAAAPQARPAAAVCRAIRRRPRGAARAAASRDRACERRAPVRVAARAAHRQGGRHRHRARSQGPARMAASWSATSAPPWKAARPRQRPPQRPPPRLLRLPPPASRRPRWLPACRTTPIRKLFEPGSFEEVPHDNMRKVIARRLLEAKQTIPHFYLTVDCQLDALLALREQINTPRPRTRTASPPTRSRSMTSSSRRWRWR